MKGKLSIFARKTFALVIAISMSFPTGVIAAGEETKTYDQATSIMGLNEKPKEDIHQTRQADNTDKLETDVYIMEARASLDQDLEKISYQVIISNKHKETSDKDLSLKFTPNPNSNITDIKVKSAKAKIENKLADIDIKERSNKGEISSLIVDTKAYDEIIMEVEANVRKAKDARTYETLIGLDDGENKLDLNYRLITNKETVREENQEKEIISLDLNKDPSQNLRGEIKSGEFLSFLQSTDALVWTDYLVNTKAESEKMTYDLKLDDKQDTKDSKISLDYFENTKEGFILKKEFSQAIDFADKIEFEIPAGYTAKLALTTRVDKKNTKTKSYRLNNREVKNSIYIEGNKESSESDDEEGGEDDHHVEIKPEENKQTEDKPNKEEQKPIEKEKPADKPAEKKAEKKEEKQTDTQITAKDSTGKDIPVIEKESKEENKEQKEEKEEISALALNKDSLITRLAGEGKLSADLEKAIEDLAEDLDAYNQGKISDQELKDFTKALGHRYNIEKSDLRTYLESILSGLNKEKNKAANLNYDEIIAYAYPEKPREKEEVKEEAKAETNPLDKNQDQKDLEGQNKDQSPKTDDKAQGQKEEPKEEVKSKEKSDQAQKQDQTKEEAKAKEEVKSFDQALNQLKEEAQKEPEKKTGIFEGLKSLVGQTDLQKADKELKQALADKTKGIEEIQNLLDSFETKYKLSRADQAKLMDDNADAIRSLVERDRENNFRPQILMATGQGLNLSDKKFHVLTRFDTSNKYGPIKAGQYFNIHLDDKLIVKNPSELKSIYNDKKIEIARPSYDSANNIIKYQVIDDINENLQIPLNIPVDYNPSNIKLDDDGTFTVINKVSGLGLINPPKDLLPQKVDANGNPVGSVIEPGRQDVTQIIEPDDANYKVNTEANALPVIENGELKGYNWTIRISSDKDLASLGYKANITTVKGSGFGEVKNIKINGKEPSESDGLSDNLIKGKLGIVDSKNHAPGPGLTDITYNFYTQIIQKQEKYMMDISVVLTNQKKNGVPKIGAKRIVIDEGWPHDKVKEATPNRAGINNRTTILGEFKSENTAKWTVTDAVSTGDGKTSLPLEKRTLWRDQDYKHPIIGKRAYYTLNPKDGRMYPTDPVEITIPLDKGQSPSSPQGVGSIAVYQFDTELIDGSSKDPLSLAGVSISKYQDISIDQNWNLPVEGMTMPAQDFIAKDSKGTELGKVHVDNGTDGQKTRFVTIPDIKYWNIDGSGNATKNDIKIEQEFDQETVKASDGKTYKYNENANYYQRDTKNYFIHDSAIEQTTLKPVTFTVVKVDSKDPSKKLEGAVFKLLGDGQPSIATDSQGKATFSNVYPGNYTLIEEKAPAGYKLDQAQKTINISENGDISVNGSNIQLVGGKKNHTKLVQHDSYPNWPDYMNAMHYGKINDKGELEFYLYLKPESNNGGGGTNKNTRLNISIPGVNITGVTAYDVSPGYRNNVKYSMEQQNVDKYIPLLGGNVINAANNNKITGTPNKRDPYTGKTGYEIKFPQQRFENDWGFLVKVKANVGNKQSVSLDYDWLTDKDTAKETKLTQSVILNKTNGQVEDEPNQLIVTNEEFTKSPISATKFGDTFKADGNRERLQGAEFVLKDNNGNVIANKFTNENGTADFGQFPPGTYRLEEKAAPDGYQKNGVYYEVVVDEQGQVTYTARFEDGIGTPQAGRDYYIEKGQETGSSTKATVTNVNQRLEYLENEPGDIGVKTGVWEAYRYESLKYHADITLSNSSPGTRFEIQFDRNLDFTQYFSAFPKIVIGGEEVADPYFDYDTNLLTYVFNNKSKGGPATASINLRGIIPDKYYATETKTYPFTIKVAPGVAGVGGNPTLNKDINADYGPYDSGTGNSNQFYYFRDVYQKEDGEWYVTVMAYLNPMGFSYGSKTTKFNWITTDFQNQQIARWNGKGYEPLYKLEDVKVYGTDFASYKEDGIWKNPYMPLSLGVRPEQDPNIYNLLAHQRINPDQKLYIRENDVTINYDPKEIKTNTRIDSNSPLRITTPGPRNKGGYIIEQTFRITDINQFNKKWRAFHMTDGNLESAFASRANVNTAKGDQAGGEIPKYYKEVIGLINHRYTSGSFKLTKYDETDQGKKLPKATFALIDENGKTIYRTSDANGEVDFTNIAPGRYTLEETKAPEGYQLTNKKWQVTVLSDGSVRIRETSITGAGQLYTGNEINIPVSNKPFGQKFRIYKKNGKGEPLAGAKFKITDPENPNFSAEATSRPNDGIVEFEATLTEGKNYILEEAKPPTGYNPLNKKWVLRVEDGKTKVYNYSDPKEDTTVEKSLLGENGTEWVDVKNRNTSGWSNYDNRWTGWVDNNYNAEHLGTRIIAINKDKKYVVQRYIINPKARQTVGVDGVTAATIHREKPEYPNMDWYKGDEEIKIFTLEPKTGGNTDGKVTGLISDIRLASYKVTEITDTVNKTPDNSHFGETRLKLEIPKTNNPIVVDVKVPYKEENGGVGTGMDWREGNVTYWKSDYYERVSDIKTSGLVSDTGGTIVGSYLAEGSLDVTNSLKTYGFKIKKVKDGETNTAVPGAVFKLTGPDDSQDERFMTTGKEGMISFDGLKPGKYTLVEEKPAPGYENVNTNWTIRVANDGKVYIKDNSPTASQENPSFTVSKPQKAATNNLMRRLQMAGASTELEISGNLVDTLNPLRAESDWETIDPAITTGLTNDSRTKVQTKITEINKKDHRFRQIFLVNVDSYGITTGFDLHRYPEERAMLPSEIYSYTAKAVGKNSSLENIQGTPKDVKLNKPTEEKKSGKPNITRIKFATRITTPVLVEIEASYDPNKAFGMGMDFYGEGMGQYSKPTAWGAQSYSSEKLVNKRTYSLTINPSNKGSVTSEKTSEIEEKERLTLEVKPNYGYELEQLMVDNNDVTTSVVDNKYPLTMPGHNVTVSATFKAKTYNITHNDPENGTIIVKDKAQYGDEVEVEVIPNDSFKTTSVTMNGQTLTADNDGKYRFKMPADNANISASFTRKGPEQRTSNPVTLTEEIPFEIQESVDNTLKPGQVVIDTQGKNGSVQYKYSITYEKSEGTSEERPADWPDNAPVAQPQAGERVISYNKIEVEGTRENPTTQIQRKGPGGPEEGEKEIPSDGFAQITNKQTGLDLKIYKKDRYDRKLEGAIFNIKKTDENYEIFDKKFGVKTGTSNAEGLVEFKDKDGNPVRLPKGYYRIEETAAPLGYRKANAPWKVQVVEENGQLVAKYKGPEETPQSFIEKNENLNIKEANGVKYATKITHIDTESRTFIQRVYIDTRGKDGVVNVQIKPKHKREEIDRPGLPPVTIKEGVKTAYRSTYKISGIDGDPNEAQMIKILNDYDVSNPNVTVVNTARWRPFDWGFDEDQLNLEPGVYYIDIEGFYDTSIIDRNVTNEVAIDSNYNFTKKDGFTPSNEPVLKNSYKLTADDIPDADLGKIDIDIEFFDGAREFQQLKNSNGKIVYGVVKDENGKDEASYQDGVVTLRQWLEDNYGKEYADNWFATKLPGQKYVNQLSKIVKIGKRDVYNAGRITPTVTPGTQGYKDPSSTIKTSMDISSLYSSDATNTVPQEGLDIENDAERYNITFSKHGKKTDKDSVEEITKRRLEGAVFKLEKRVREGIYEEVEGSYVSSAFNGYFGFRGLEPGRYRLIEVQAPKGYKPIDGPLLHFSVETVSIVSQRITDPRTGENINVKEVEFYFPENDTPYKFEDLEMHDPVTNKVIKFKDAKNADLETTRIINPLDKSKEIPLRDLSIKFPGEIKDKEGNVIKDTYKLSEIQITPTSNGYISLEYDKANGVYQYIPEKSTTEENGLLVDYVTSATAKNMGKIVNEKPGQGKVTINKVDQDGIFLKGTANKKGELIAGAKFRLTNLTDGSKPVEKRVGTDGSLVFEGLKIGNYKLEEIESPDGHINSGQEWHFTVGGKDLDPYAGDIAQTGRDLTDKITLTSSEMKVINPQKKDKLPTAAGEIHPHVGESMEFDNKFKLAENIKINPGDYFKLKVADATDLFGIFVESISSLDLFADGVGTIAKASYDKDQGIITYTFTDYAKTYDLVKFSNKYTSFINLDEVKKSDGLNQSHKVGFKMANDQTDTNYKNLRVVYDLDYALGYDENNQLMNMVSKIVKYNPETGEFVHYYYVNRLRYQPTGTKEFWYTSEQNIENLNISYSYLKNNNNTYLGQDMPESFGINENSKNLNAFENLKSIYSLPKGETTKFELPNGTYWSDSCIVKVTGRVADEDKSTYKTDARLVKYNSDGPWGVVRYDEVYAFPHEATAEAKLTIRAVNPANKIKFIKVDESGKTLSGAVFQIEQKVVENQTENWNAYRQPITTKEDGLIEINELPEGEYRLIETTAPEGFVKPEGPVAEFKVDINGKVYRKEFYKDDQGNTREKYVEEPGILPINLLNKKEQEISFKKVDTEGNPLPGAEFELWFKQSKEGEYSNKNISLYKDENNNLYALKSDYKVPADYTKLDKFVSGKDGLVKFKVYESGYYALKETKAPKGYLTPKDFVKEFAIIDGKVQTEKYKTEMDVNKTTGFSMSNDVFQKSYTTNMTLRFNPSHEDVTYVKDKSTITLSDLPLKSEIWDNSFNSKQPISISAYLVDNDNKETTTKTYTLDLTKDYNSGTKASTTIDLYSLVKELENQTADGDIRSNKTLVLEMTSSLYLKSELDIKSNIVIGDKIKEERTFHIETKGDEYVDHSYSFGTMGEMDKVDGKEFYKPIEIENKKVSLPNTNGLGAWIGFTIIGLAVMVLAGFYYNKKKIIG